MVRGVQNGANRGFSCARGVIEGDRMDEGHAVQGQQRMYLPRRANRVDKHFSKRAPSGTIVPRKRIFPRCTDEMDTSRESRITARIYFLGRCLKHNSSRCARTLSLVVRSFSTVKQMVFRQRSTVRFINTKCRARRLGNHFRGGRLS